VRTVFLAHHAELLAPEFWQDRQRRIRAGLLEDVFPYPDGLRFRHRLAGAGASAVSSPEPLARSLS
jgi:isocitrate dehydrogenase kinase/phosphatase